MASRNYYPTDDTGKGVGSFNNYTPGPCCSCRRLKVLLLPCLYKGYVVSQFAMSCRKSNVLYVSVCC